MYGCHSFDENAPVFGPVDERYADWTQEKIYPRVVVDAEEFVDTEEFVMMTGAEILEELETL
jgi:hypothetical protein